jgi:hypothetical protein
VTVIGADPLEETIERVVRRIIDEGAADQDQLAPNVLTLAADGSIGADFTGHVHARGLDLDEGGGPAPPTDRRLRWINTGNGLAAEQIFGTKATDGTGVNRYLVMRADDDNVSEAMLQLVARGAGATPSGVYAFAQPPGGVIPGNQPGCLVDEANRSDWMQVTGTPFGTKKRVCEGPFTGAFAAIPVGGSITLLSANLGIPFTSTAVFVGGFFDPNGWGSYCQFSWNFNSAVNFTITVTNVGPSTMGTGSNWAAFCIHD